MYAAEIGVDDAIYGVEALVEATLCLPLVGFRGRKLALQLFSLTPELVCLGGEGLIGRMPGRW